MVSRGAERQTLAEARLVTCGRMSDPADHKKGIVFPGVQETTWNVGRGGWRGYHFHRFYEFQPDLNTANPAVRC